MKINPPKKLDTKQVEDRRGMSTADKISKKQWQKSDRNASTKAKETGKAKRSR